MADPVPAPDAAPVHKPGLRDAVEALRVRDFAVFWTGALFSNTGSWIQRTAIPFVIFEMTGSATWVGLAAFLQFLPAVLLGPFGGSLADRRSRRSLLMVTQAAMAVLAVALWAVFALEAATPTLVVGLVALSGVLGGLNMPTWQAFVSELVPRRLLLNAVTLNSAQFNAAKALGPAAAGVILATGGPAWAFLANALSYGAVLVALALIHPRPAATALGRRPRLVGELRDTVRYIRRRPGMAVAVKLVIVLGFTGGPVFTLLKVFADEVFHVGDTAFGVLGAAIGVGAVLGAPLIAGWGGGQPRSRLAFLSVVGYGSSVAAFALAPVYGVAVVALLVMGASHLAVASTLNTTMQLQVDDALRGKAMALYLMGLTGSVPFGSLLQGWLADVVGPRITVAVAGAVLATSALWFRDVRGLLTHMDDAPTGDDSLVGDTPGDDAPPTGAEVGPQRGPTSVAS